MKRLAISLLRLLIGVGFTFSLAFGVTLTLLTLCDNSGNNLTLSRTGPHWEWSSYGVMAWLSTLFWWLCWRLLPAAKPTQMFPALERWLQPRFIWAVLAAASLLLTVSAGLGLIHHTPGAKWSQFWSCCLMAFSYGLWAMSAWRQERDNREKKSFLSKFYARK